MTPRLATCLFMLLLSATNPIFASPRSNQAIIQLFQSKRCDQCDLNEADLVHAQLNDSFLTGARLRRANLNHAQLNGSDLRSADLSFASLRGSSLRGANLMGANLYGTDLRGADLTGAQLSTGALLESHWQGAKGIMQGVQSHEELHNAGVDAALEGRWNDAETLFGLAIKQTPENALSWVARGIARSQLVKDELAASDWHYAAALFEKTGSDSWARQLQTAADSIQKRRHVQDLPENSNGIGSNFLNGIISALSSIAPIAIQALKYAAMGAP